MLQAAYPDLKTHVLEHPWLQSVEVDCNTAFDPDPAVQDCHPYSVHRPLAATEPRRPPNGGGQPPLGQLTGLRHRMPQGKSRTDRRRQGAADTVGVPGLHARPRQLEENAVGQQ